MTALSNVPLRVLVSPVSTWSPLKPGNDEDFDYIDLSAIDQKLKAIVSARKVQCTDAPSRARQLVRRGDVLVSTVRPNLNGVAMVPPELDGATASTGFCVIRANREMLEPSYVFHWVKSATFVSRMVAQATGASYPAVSDRIVLDAEIPLPSLPEQRRIAAILDKADGLRTKRGEALAQLDRLAQSIFMEMFGDPVTNPKGWPLRSFNDACPTRLGKMLDQKQQTGQHSRKYLRNANVQWFRFDLSDLLEMDFDEAARETFALKDGDLLICEGGEPGRAAIWRNQIPDCYYQKALHRGRPDPSLANSEYLMWLLWCLAQRGGLSDHVTSATIAHLTGEKLKAIQIPLPPLQLQSQFVERLKAHERLRLRAEQALTGQDLLFASLQHRAFRGEL